MKDPKNFKYLSNNIREDSRERGNQRSEVARVARTFSACTDVVGAAAAVVFAGMAVRKMFGGKNDDRRDNNRRRLI